MLCALVPLPLWMAEFWCCSTIYSSAQSTHFAGNASIFLVSASGVVKLDNWGGHIHIFVFTDHKNNRFQKKLIVQNTNIWICTPHLSSWLRNWYRHSRFDLVYSACFFHFDLKSCSIHEVQDSEGCVKTIHNIVRQCLRAFSQASLYLFEIILNQKRFLSQITQSNGSRSF